MEPIMAKKIISKSAELANQICDMLEGVPPQYDTSIIESDMIDIRKALKLANDRLRTCPECSSPRILHPNEARCGQCETQDYTDRHTTNPTTEE